MAVRKRQIVQLFVLVLYSPKIALVHQTNNPRTQLLPHLSPATKYGGLAPPLPPSAPPPPPPIFSSLASTLAAVPLAVRLLVAYVLTEPLVLTIDGAALVRALADLPSEFCRSASDGARNADRDRFGSAPARRRADEICETERAPVLPPTWR